MEIVEQEWNKLVRDRVPDWIKSHGGVVETRILEDDTEFDALLRVKDCEEGEEIKEAEDREHLIEEIVDQYAVLDALKSLHGVTDEEIKTKRIQKRLERGEYEKRIFLIRTRGEKYA